MANVTLIGEKQAKKDKIFLYLGPLSECRDCKVKTVCFNLEEGRTYRIKDIRAMHHNCKVHDSGVHAVEYEIQPIEFAIDTNAAVEKARITAEEKADCVDRGCENYKYCYPKGLKAGSQYEIKSVEGNITCSEGKSLKKVLLIDIY